MDLESCSSSSSSSFVMHQISPFNPNPSKLISLTPSPVPKRKAGRKKFKETRHPTYRGIRLRNRNKWVCEVREPKKKSRLWLGTFPCPKMAARAHDVAALALRGNSASLNFPEMVSLLPRAKSSSPEDIQAAALEAAQGTISDDIGCSDQNSNQLDNRCQTFVEMEGDEVQIYDGSVMVYDDDGFFDEEAVFNMPSLLQSMAEGMLIAPPALVRGMFDSEHEINNLEEDVYLWSH